MQDQEKGFVLGACEDGTVYFKKNRNQYTIEIEQKNPQWLGVVQKAVLMAYKKRSIIYKTPKGYYRLLIYSKKIYSDLVPKRTNHLSILAERKKYQLGYLQGIAYAEGTVHKDRFQIRISSKDIDTINVVREILERNGIKTGKVSEDETAYVLPMYGRKNLMRFKSAVGFRHAEKEERLAKLSSV